MSNYKSLNLKDRGGIRLPDFFYIKGFLSLCLCLCLCFLSCKSAVQPTPKTAFVPYSAEELQKRTFNYFWELADSTNYQIPDRYPNLTFSSIAATGFGLSAYIVGVEKKYVTRQQAAERTLNTLNVLWTLPQGNAEQDVSGFHGFFYHFLTMDKATRFKDVELSSIDTGLLMAGILSAMSYYDDTIKTERMIRAIADSLYRRVEWDWMMNGHKTMSMGYHPEADTPDNTEKGFIPAQWKGYNEAMVLLIMAIGSPTHPISPDAWKVWCSTYTWDYYKGFDFVQFEPLFGHQYSHVWIDFRDIRDAYMREKRIDYFENSTRATFANRNYCIENPLRAKGYGLDCWGLTACDGPASTTMDVNGKPWQFYDYRARGASSQHVVDDGTIAPTAAGGSYPFTPEQSEAALKYMWTTYYDDLVGEYGFKDAFNLTYVTDKTPKGWFDVDYLGIDQGPILLMMANHENDIIWNVMKKNPYIAEGLKKAGFEGGWLERQGK